MLASTLSKTEIMVLNFYQQGHLSQRMGQALMNMMRHPQFRVEDLQSSTIVQLLRRLERPFKECVMVEYNLWMPGDGNQKLTLVVRDYLEVFREIMRDPRWNDQFYLVARAIFDQSGHRLIGPPCSALNWERIQQKSGMDVAVGMAQLYFDGTFMGATVGFESCYVGSLNLNSGSKFQNASVKMFALLPTYDRAAKHLSQSSAQAAQRRFNGGKADKAKPCGDGSKLYELNLWAMTIGRPRKRTVAEELAPQQLLLRSLLPRKQKQGGMHKQAQDR